MSDFHDKLCDILGSDKVKTNEKMDKHTTFRVGGPAAYFVTPGNSRELSDVICLCSSRSVPYYILGNGSNLLVGDRGYDGVMIAMMSGWNYCTVVDDTVTAGAGTLLSAIAKKALDCSLTGFEFAAGIPGTLGGAVVMNAGAYGYEMKDVLVKVRVLTPQGDEKTLLKPELDFGYRSSCIQEKGYVVLEAEFALKPGEASAIKARMTELAVQRNTKQPLTYPSAGSTFKRPEGHYAGKLIQDAGLCGYQHGGAQVSEKHCGFIINKDHAKASDILELCDHVKNEVKSASGVELEMEVKRLGTF